MSTQLAKEIGKRHPFELAEEEAFLNLWRTQTLLAEPFEHLFRAHGLCPTHYNILRILAGEADAGSPGVPILTVRQRLITRVPDITRLVNKLQRLGLISRLPAPADRRVGLLRITDKGLAFLHDLAPQIAELHRLQLGHLSRTELQSLCDLLEKAREHAVA